MSKGKKSSLRRKVTGILTAFLFVGFLFATVAQADDLKQHFSKAQTFYKQGKLQEACLEFRKVADLLVKAKNKEAAQKVVSNIGTLQFKSGNYDKAAESFKEAIALYKMPSIKFAYKLHGNLAGALYAKGDYAGSVKSLKYILEKFKLNTDQKNNISLRLADSYRRNEIYSQAVSYYQKALASLSKKTKSPSLAKIHISLGLCLIKLGRHKEAIEHLNAVIKQSKGLQNQQALIEAKSNLGIAYWDLGQYAQALKQIQSAMDLERKANLKRNLGADYNNQGLIFKSAGQYEKALRSIDQALNIAEEIKNTKDQAIAYGNRALIFRIKGCYQKALADYETSLKLCLKVGFKEGSASSHMGVGKLYEVHQKDYQLALKHYNKALAIYRELENPAYQAEAYNQIGRIYRTGIDPERVSRDLIFEDDPPKFLKISKKEAAQKSGEAYAEALRLGEKTGKKEVIWSALQGLGFACKNSGKLKKALKYYSKAIETVMSINGLGNDSELLADYLKDKEDLFTEAIEVVSALVQKENDPKYLVIQLNFQEIYKNEVIKNASLTVSPKFKDEKKNKLCRQMYETLARKKKIDSSRQSLASQLTSQEQRKKPVNSETKEEARKLEVASSKLDKTYQKQLEHWKSKYPGDAAMFDSSSKIDIQDIKKGLSRNQALLQYFPLSGSLNIICVTKEHVKSVSVPVSYRKLSSIIRNDFIWDQIELFGHAKSTRSEKEDLVKCHEVLAELYDLLLKPVADLIEKKDHLIVVPSKYLSYVPFSALVSELKDKEKPRYVIHDKTISYIRLSYFKKIFAQSNAGQSLSKDMNIMALGNPDHKYLKAALPSLPGTESEIAQMSKTAEANNLNKPVILLREQATEDAWRDLVEKKPYQVFYFATHGVPFAELLQDRRKIGKAVEKWGGILNQGNLKGKKKAKTQAKYEKYKPFITFCEEAFPSKSPLLGFLYMSYSGKEKYEGALTLKDILELPETSFKDAKVAVLSACNTAVTYSPKIKDSVRKELENKEVDQELIDSGFSPGVDQICLADTFMRRNFQSVLGTLWFADDQAAGFIVGHFFGNLVSMPPAQALRKAQLAYLENPPLKGDYTKAPRHPFFWAVPAMFGR